MNINSQNESQSQWEIDILHSELIFKIQHLMISTLSGRMLEGEFGGMSIGLDNKKRAGFRVRGKISREEF